MNVESTDRGTVAVVLDRVDTYLGTTRLSVYVGDGRGRGVGRAAVRLAVEHAFSVLDLSRIEAGCLPENTPSRRLLEGCGYKYEGVAQAYLQINGRWRNHVLYANLRHDRRGRTDAG